MYKTMGESVETSIALKPLVANANHCEVVIAPVFTAIKTVADRLEGSNIHVSGQDCSTEVREGAHTGEVAAFMLRDAGARSRNRRTFRAPAVLFRDRYDGQIARPQGAFRPV